MRLRAFGGLSIEGAPESVGPAAGQRRPLALLLLLAVAGDRGISRDKLLLYLWPESDADHARGALRQTLSALRRDLALPDLFIGTNELRLNAALLPSDVAEFQAAIARADDAGRQQAVSLYAGPLADGFYLSKAVEFERWLDAERSGCARQFSSAAETLARDASRRGDCAEAVALWRRVAGQEPLNARIALQLMTALAEAGDSAGALQHARVYEQLVSAELGAKPDPAVMQFVARLRAGGEAAASPRVSPPEIRESPAPASPVAARIPARRRAVLVVVAVAAVAIAAALAVRGAAAHGDSLDVLAFDIAPPSGIEFMDELRDVSALSPNGREILFAGIDSKGIRRIWVRPLSSNQPVPVPGADSGHGVFWAPDGKSIGFFRSRRLVIADRAGRWTRSLAQTTMDPRGGSWGTSGAILYTPGSHSGVFLTSSSDTTPRELTTPNRERGEIGHLWPQMLPNGRDFIYLVTSLVDSVRGIYMASIEKPNDARRIVGSGASAAYANGYLLYVDDGELIAQALDVRGRRLVGERRTLADSIAVSYEYNGAFSASQNGTLIYANGQARDISELRWIDTSGHALGEAITRAGYYRNPILSRDGQYLAYEIHREATGNIGIEDLRTGRATRLQDPGGQALVPVWSPDHSRVAFVMEVPEGWAIYAQQVDVATSPVRIWTSPDYVVLTDWSPDGKTLLLMQRPEFGDYDVLSLRLDSISTTVLAGGKGHQGTARFDDSGEFIAYVSLESGDPQVYIEPFSPGGSRCQVSSHGGWHPVWDRTGHQIYFLGPTGAMMVAPVDPHAKKCNNAAPHELFQTPIRSPASARSFFDVAVSGSRFVFNVPSTMPNSQRLSVLVNWPARMIVGY